MIGQKIKELRTKNFLTQKELADKLFVSYQAVSRWENDEVEPSIDTIKKMASIFGVSIDELLDYSNSNEEQIENEEDEENQELTEEKEVDNGKKHVHNTPPLTICEVCNKPIYTQDGIKRYEYKKTVYSGSGRRQTTHYEDRSKVMCESCYKKQIDEDKKKKEKIESERVKSIKTRRVWGFVLSAIVFVTLLVIGIVLLAKGNSAAGVALMISSVFGAMFVGCVIMNNTFITGLWVDIATWSIHLPGVIFSLDFEGLAFLIVVKILMAILSVVLDVLIIAFATAVGMFMSIFAYPLALYRSFKLIDYDD